MKLVELMQDLRIESGRRALEVMGVVLAGFLLAVRADLDKLVALGDEHADGATLLVFFFLRSVLVVPAFRCAKDLDVQDAEVLFKFPLDFNAAADLEVLDDLDHGLIGSAAFLGRPTYPMRYVATAFLLAVRFHFDESRALVDKR